jgi:ribosomal protein S8E
MVTSTATLLLCSISLHATTQGPDLALSDVQDLTIRAEIAGTGPYQERSEEDHDMLLVAVPLTSWSPGHVEFRGEGLRVRLEAQPFDDVRGVKLRNGNAELDRAPIIGWCNDDQHTRLSRMEVVMDGSVVQVPVSAFTDLFDLPLTREHGGVQLCAAWRSRDGWRTYVQAQVGDDAHALIVTWVMEDGRYLQRIVDRMY